MSYVALLATNSQNYEENRMIEVYQNLWVGDDGSFNSIRHQQGWATVHACKEPYHRRALGYSGRGAPKNDPEYLVAHRGLELMLNMVDADTPDYIPKSMVNEALTFIGAHLTNGFNVLIHCNQGMSRSPGIAILFLAQKGEFQGLSYEQAKEVFRKTYPNYNPAGGIDGFCRLNWNEYRA